MSRQYSFDSYAKKCVELARLSGFEASSWEDLDERAKRVFLLINDYKAIVTPLILRDREKGLSLSALCIKYSLPMRVVRTIISKSEFRKRE